MRVRGQRHAPATLPGSIVQRAGWAAANMAASRSTVRSICQHCVRRYWAVLVSRAAESDERRRCTAVVTMATDRIWAENT